MPNSRKSTHLDHAPGERCPICDETKKPWPLKEVYIRETENFIHTRPEGVEPGKLEIARRKHPAGRDRR